jgi:integrase
MAKYQKREHRVGSFWLSQRAGSTAWYRTFYDPDAKQTRRVSLGTDDFEKARDALDDWYAAERMKRGQDLPVAEVLLKDVFKEYLENHAVNLRSYESVKILLRYWQEFWGDTATVADVRNIIKQEEFRAELFSKGLAVNSVNRALEAGRAAITRAFKRNVISSKPHVEVLPYERDKPKGRPLSVEEIRALYTECADHMRLFTILMLGTGARNEAICHLEWSQIDFENNLIYLNPEGRKQTSKRRPVVRLVPFVREQLLKINDREGRVLLFRGKSMNTAYQGIGKAVGRAKIKGRVTPYSFRHTVARWLRKEGVSPWEVGAQLGHKMPGYNITEMYASASPDYLEKSALAIEKLLREAIPLDAPPIPSGR